MKIGEYIRLLFAVLTLHKLIESCLVFVCKNRYVFGFYPRGKAEREKSPKNSQPHQIFFDTLKMERRLFKR